MFPYFTLLCHYEDNIYNPCTGAGPCGKQPIWFEKKKNREKKVPKSSKKVWSKVGRPAVLDDRDKRRLERAVKKIRSTNPNFSVMDIVQASGIDTNRASYHTFVRYVKKIGICIL